MKKHARKMRRMRKAAALIACMVLLVAITVGVTVAYLTDNDSVTNTFTVGNVDISLAETDVDEDNDTKANAYHLIPGSTYTKDPTVTIEKASEPSYVRMFVEVGKYSGLVTAVKNHPNEKDSYDNPYYVEDGSGNTVVLLQTFTDWTEASNWDFENVVISADKTTATYEFRYNTVTEKNADAAYKLPALFNTITIPGWMTNADLAAMGEFEIKVRAEAIQASGFDSDDAAWDAFKN